jgi:hypothetical protein
LQVTGAAFDDILFLLKDVKDRETYIKQYFLLNKTSLEGGSDLG